MSRDSRHCSWCFSWLQRSNKCGKYEKSNIKKKQNLTFLILNFEKPCCVEEELNITCPFNYDRYANALVKSYGLLNTTSKHIATPQRVIAWAPFLLNAIDEAIGNCVYDPHKVSFIHFFVSYQKFEKKLFTTTTFFLRKDGHLKRKFHVFQRNSWLV